MIFGVVYLAFWSVLLLKTKRSFSNAKINLVIITGMSGAGKTVAIQSFEDMGYFTIDNMPANLIEKFISLLTTSESSDIDKVAMVVDMRSRSFFDALSDIVNDLSDNPQVDFRLLFWIVLTKNWLRAIKKRVAVILLQKMVVFWMASCENVSCYPLKIIFTKCD